MWQDFFFRAEFIDIIAFDVVHKENRNLEFSSVVDLESDTQNTISTFPFFLFF